MTFTRANALGWTDNSSTISATQINKIDIDHISAVDGLAGGTYTPSDKISIGGDHGLEINGTAGQPGHWLRYDARTFTRNVPLRIAHPPDDPTQAVLQESDVSITIDGVAFKFPEVYMYGAGGTPFLTCLDIDPPDGQELDTIVIRKKYETPGLVVAGVGSWNVLRWSYASGTASAATLISTGWATDNQDTASYAAYNTVTAQTLTPDQNNVIDRSTYRYAVAFYHQSSANDPRVRLYEILASYTVTSEVR